jgi:hypothetical protein
MVPRGGGVRAVMEAYRRRLRKSFLIRIEAAGLAERALLETGKPALWHDQVLAIGITIGN